MATWRTAQETSKTNAPTAKKIWWFPRQVTGSCNPYADMAMGQNLSAFLGRMNTHVPSCTTYFDVPPDRAKAEPWLGASQRQLLAQIQEVYQAYASEKEKASECYETLGQGSTF